MLAERTLPDDMRDELLDAGQTLETDTAEDEYNVGSSK